MNVVSVFDNLKGANISTLVNHNFRPPHFKISAMKIALKFFIPTPDFSHINTECFFFYVVAELGIQLCSRSKMYKMWFHDGIRVGAIETITKVIVSIANSYFYFFSVTSPSTTSPSTAPSLGAS